MRTHVATMAVVLAAWSLACGGGSAPSPEGAEGESPLSAREGTSPGATPTTGSAIPSTGPVPEGCVRLEGADLGREGLEVALPGATVTLGSWVTKDGEPGEYVGFSYTVSAGTVDFAVKCGGDTFHASGSPWAHPAGRAGPEASAISNITLCPSADDGGGAPPACSSDAQCGPGLRCHQGTCVPIIG